MIRGLLVAVAAAFISVPRPALGADVAAERAQPQWYGMPLVIADVGAFALMSGGFALLMPPLEYGTPSEVGWSMLLVGGAAYLVDGPAVHVANGEWKGAAASLGMRLGLATIPGLAGALLAVEVGRHCVEESCGVANAALGLTIGAATGMVTASVIDNLLLTWKCPAPSGAATMLIAPVVDPRRSFAGVGLRGTW
jgi:hypothetical protein